MDLYMRVGEFGEPVHVGTFDGDTPAAAHEALADLLVACAEAIRGGAPVLDIPESR